MAMRPNWYRDEPRSSWGGRRGFGGWTAVTAILALTVLVFLLQHVLGPGFIDALSLAAYQRPDAPADLAARAVGGRPELHLNLFFPVQLVTYALLHAGGLHLLMNMWLLFLFGPELEARLGSRAFVRLYVGGAVVGGLFFWLSKLFTQNPVPVVGASGALFAVLVLYACLNPNRTLIVFPFPFPVRVITLVLVYVAWNLFQWLGGGGGGVAVEAHLGGAAFGYLWFRRGDVVDQAVQKRRREQAMRRWQDDQQDRREMDRILAKIQATGLSSLTDAEREFLARRSQDLRRRHQP